MMNRQLVLPYAMAGVDLLNDAGHDNVIVVEAACLTAFLGSFATLFLGFLFESVPLIRLLFAKSRPFTLL
jgi:hypothetical protein